MLTTLKLWFLRARMALGIPLPPPKPTTLGPYRAPGSVPDYPPPPAPPPFVAIEDMDPRESPYAAVYGDIHMRTGATYRQAMAAMRAALSASGKNWQGQVEAVRELQRLTGLESHDAALAFKIARDHVRS